VWRIDAEGGCRGPADERVFAAGGEQTPGGAISHGVLGMGEVFVAGLELGVVADADLQKMLPPKRANAPALSTYLSMASRISHDQYSSWPTVSTQG
jgi:hypothetical protein